MATLATKADTSWTQKWFREQYEPWFQEARPLIEQHQYGAAFKTYPFPAFDQSPWSPVQIPLSAARLGIVSTAGLYRRDVDLPFADTSEGDPRVIELPRNLDSRTLACGHSHIPHDLIQADVNVVLPLDPLRAFVQEGRLGEIAPRIFSLIGYRTRADEVAAETAPRIAAAMEEDGVTLGLVIPV